MFANLGVATAAKTTSGDPNATGHYLRQIGPTGTETIAMWPNRLGSNRGNAYFNPLGVLPSGKGILPSFDCDNVGGEKKDTGGTPPSPPCCQIQKPFEFKGSPTTRYPQLRGRCLEEVARARRRGPRGPRGAGSGRRCGSVSKRLSRDRGVGGAAVLDRDRVVALAPDDQRRHRARAGRAGRWR